MAGGADQGAARVSPQGFSWFLNLVLVLTVTVVVVVD